MTERRETGQSPTKRDARGNRPPKQKGRSNKHKTDNITD